MAYGPLLTSARGTIQGFITSDFLRHGALVLGATLSANVFNYGFHFVLSRALGVGDYGALSSLIAALALAAIPASVVMLTVVKFAAEFAAVGDVEHLDLLAIRIVKFGGIAAAFAFLAVLLFHVQVAQYLKISQANTVLLAGFILVTNFILPPLRGLLQGKQNFKALAISTIVETAGNAFLGITFAVVFRRGLLGAMEGYLLGTLCSLAYTIYALQVHWNAEGVLKINLRRLWKTSGGVAASTGILTALAFIDVPLVKHFFDPHEAGIYAAVSLAGKVFLFAVGFIPTIVLPKAAARTALGTSPRSILGHGLFVASVVSLLGLLVVFLAPAFVIKLMAGNQYMGAVPFVGLYSVAMTLLALTGIVTSYKVGIHRFDFIAPLLVVAVGEIAAIHLRHNSLLSIIQILIVANALCLVASLYRVFDRVAIPDGVSMSSRKGVTNVAG